VGAITAAGLIKSDSLNVTNDITAGGNITGKAITGTSLALSGDITGANTITASALNADSLKIAGGSMSVDVNGNLTANTLTLSANGATTVTIGDGDQSVSTGLSAGSNTIIVATPTSDPGSFWWVDSSGVINLKDPAPVGGVTFNCIAVNN